MTRLILIILPLVIGAIVLAFLPPIPQWESYHQYAGPRLPIVLSNIPLMLVGIWGLFTTISVRRPFERLLWRALAFGFLLIGIGSVLYHLNPNNQTLVWDRLPMAFAFMVLFSIILFEQLDVIWPSPFLIAIGIASVFVWQYTDDLRLYGLVQYYPAIAIPLLLFLFPSPYTKTAYLWAMIAFYLLAKVCELSDSALYDTTYLSGHLLKHLFSAAAALCPLLYAHTRSITS